MLTVSDLIDCMPIPYNLWIFCTFLAKNISHVNKAREVYVSIMRWLANGDLVANDSCVFKTHMDNFFHSSGNRVYKSVFHFTGKFNI